MSLSLAFLAGLLTVLSPCVLPLLPIIVGASLSGHRLGPVTLCLGLSLSFSLLGVTAALAAHAFGFDPATIRIIGAILILLFGIILVVPLANERFSRLLGPLAARANAAAARAGTGLVGSFVTGGLLGAIWSPCAGPTLGAAIGLATQAETAARGLTVMLVYGFAASVPLLALGYGARGLFQANRSRLMAAASKMKPAFGIALLAVALSILAGWDKQLEAKALQTLPQSWIELITRY